jgi:hypothetical protein
MKYLTKIAAILFAYFCDSTTRFFMFVFTPLGMLLHWCFGGEDWRVRRNRGINDVVEIGARITPLLTWMCLTITILVFWAKILEKYFFFEDHVKVANGSMILLGVTILPFIIWWIRNKDFILDVKNNILLGKENRILFTLTSFFFFLLQISMPFIVLLII